MAASKRDDLRDTAILRVWISFTPEFSNHIDSILDVSDTVVSDVSFFAWVVGGCFGVGTDGSVGGKMVEEVGDGGFGLLPVARELLFRC